MGSRTIAVTWNTRTNGPTAPDVTVDKNDGQTTITWQAGEGVSNIQIQGLDANEFTDMNGDGSDSVSVLDKNDNATNTEYSYTIVATHTSGRTAQHDPKIMNGGRPGVATRAGKGATRTRSAPPPRVD